MLEKIPFPTIKRLPIYFQYIQNLKLNPSDYISAASIARGLALNEVSVRKDLALICGNGRPKIGYEKSVLIYAIESALGWNETNEAVIVGIGKLGQALISYDGFKTYGLNIVAGFDKDENLFGTHVCTKPIFSMDKLENLCFRMGIKIGIITVDAHSAQYVSDLLISAGVQAIWNFAPVNLFVPDTVIVHNENMAASLALLSSQLKQRHLI